MKKNILTFILLNSICFSSPYLKHKVLNKTINPPFKYSVDILVYPKDGNLPGDKSLQKLAYKFKAEMPGFKNYFVVFLLPEMQLNSGAYAITNDTERERNQMMKVKILRDAFYNTKYESYIKFDNKGNYIPLPFYEE